MKSQVWNKYHKNYPADSMSIMRDSPWGNPYSHQNGTLAKFKVSSREEAIQKHAEDLFNNPDMVFNIQKRLKGRHTLCVCKPKDCHGDILQWIANDLNIEDLIPLYSDFTCG